MKTVYKLVSTLVETKLGQTRIELPLKYFLFHQQAKDHAKMRIKEVKTKLKQRVGNRVTHAYAELHWKQLPVWEQKLAEVSWRRTLLRFLLHFQRETILCRSSQHCSTMESSSGVSLHLSVSVPHRNSQKTASLSQRQPVWVVNTRQAWPPMVTSSGNWDRTKLWMAADPLTCTSDKWDYFIFIETSMWHYCCMILNDSQQTMKHWHVLNIQDNFTL